MLFIHLKTLLRNIKRHRIYSFINIGGLSIGFTLFILIMLFIQNEYSYDRFNENFERIYRIEINSGCVMPAGIGHILEGQLPELEEIVRIYPSYGEKTLIKYDEKLLQLSNLVFADSSVFDVFTFPFLQGDPATAIEVPFSMVLTESTAKSIFGSENPLGNAILVDNKWYFTITGIISDVKKSHLPINAIASFVSLGDMWGEEALTQLDDGYQHPTYFLLPEAYDEVAVEHKINSWLNGRHNFGENSQFKLRPLKNLYFANEKLLGDQYQRHGNKQLIKIFCMIAIFILLIAGINFINLSTSRASERAKEVGMKKVVGASRNQLVYQFLFESVLITCTALILGFMAAEFLMPIFNPIISENLTISSFLKFPFLLLFMGGAILLGIMAGFYPALYLSAFVPNIVLKGTLTRGHKAAKLRKALIVFQFSISVVLIIATLTISKQLSFMKNADLGFKKDHILVLDNNRNLWTKKEVLRNELIKHSNISNVSFSCRVPGETMWNWSPKINEKRATISVNAVDPDFFQTYGIAVMSGRNFSWAMSTDSDNKFIVNEAALRFFEIDSPLGKRVEDVPNGNGTGEIIGVVKDFHFNSLHTSINPVIFYWLDWPHQKISVKISLIGTAASMSGMEKTIGYIKDKWAELCPDYPFEYSFLDESFDLQYKSEERLANIFISFALLAIFIACLGLFGLSSFMAERRKKEIGVRKVLGASSFEIALLLSKEFTKWVLIANIFAWPIAFYMMNKWLENFAYRASIGIFLFLLPALVALLIALFTVSFQSIKAATANPVDSLRYE